MEPRTPDSSRGTGYGVNSTMRSVPKPHNPARGGQQAVRAVFFVLAGVSVLGAAIWSTYSLYQLMAANSAHWAALLACGVLDMAWVASLAMAAADVYGGDWRAECWSWGTLIASAGVSAMHGWQVNSWSSAVLGVLFTIASKGLTQSFLHTTRPKLNQIDRERMKERDYQRRISELDRQKQAELANDDFRWGLNPDGTEATLELPLPAEQNRLAQLLNQNQHSRVQLSRLTEPEPELEVPNWVNPTRPQLERPSFPNLKPEPPQVPPVVPPAQVVQAATAPGGSEPPAPVAEPPAEPAGTPAPEPLAVPEPEPTRPERNWAEATRAEKVQDLAEEIGKRGGHLSAVPLAEVIGTYGLKPTAKATASNLRKDAHKHWLNTAPGTGNFM